MTRLDVFTHQTRMKLRRMVPITGVAVAGAVRRVSVAGAQTARARVPAKTQGGSF